WSHYRIYDATKVLCMKLGLSAKLTSGAREILNVSSPGSEQVWLEHNDGCRPATCNSHQSFASPEDLVRVIVVDVASPVTHQIQTRPSRGPGNGLSSGASSF
ncbi:hypothetical protein J6590_042500, partial [Homalodisca vitripennis]